MEELSSDDLAYGTTRKLLTFQGSGVGEDGYYNLQTIEGSGVMSMNAGGGEVEEEADCEELEEALDACLNEKNALNQQIASGEKLKGKYYDHILTLTGLYCGTWFQMRALMPTPVQPNGYFKSLNASCIYQVADLLPTQVNVAFAVYEDENNPLRYKVYYTSSSPNGNNDRWSLYGGPDVNGNTLVFGPITVNETGGGNFQFTERNCNVSLTLKVFSRFNTQDENSGFCELGELPCPTGTPQPPCPAPPIPT